MSPIISKSNLAYTSIEILMNVKMNVKIFIGTNTFGRCKEQDVKCIHFTMEDVKCIQ